MLPSLPRGGGAARVVGGGAVVFVEEAREGAGCRPVLLPAAPAAPAGEGADDAADGVWPPPQVGPHGSGHPVLQQEGVRGAARGQGE